MTAQIDIIDDSNAHLIAIHYFYLRKTIKKSK